MKRCQTRSKGSCSFCRVLAAAVLAAVLMLVPLPVLAADGAETARPSVTGRLRVADGRLSDAAGNAVQLRGISTHGLTWFPDYINGSLFGQIADDWNCNLIRLAMYSEFYCGEEKEESLALMKQGIDLAVRADMYVLVDWHILNDADPNENADAAAAFFEEISAEYRDCPNLIFEICNEPNGATGWGDVLAYCDRVIPAIRANMPDAVVVVGTPDYDRNLGDCLLRPLPYGNVMYVLHFYAASHHETLFEELGAAVDAGLPVFISECGLSEASGDGDLDFAWAAKWFSYLNEKQISYAVWSLSDKEEASAFFRRGFDPLGEIRDGDLTPAGAWVRALIRGGDPNGITAPAARLKQNKTEKLKAWFLNSVGETGVEAVRNWGYFALVSGALVLAVCLIGLLYGRERRKKRRTYDDIVGRSGEKPKAFTVFSRAVLIAGAFITLVYLGWRVYYSIPFGYGPVAVAANLLLLFVEALGFAESVVMFSHLVRMREHPLPAIPEDAWPDVDVFIATYNEPVELLRRTVNGCVHMKYPDKSKVHIYICDDNRRPEMRALAKELGVGYFDRPDNSGAKAGNLNHALGLTSSPYIVTFDADMIPQSGFLLKTIPYFVDVELREKDRPENERLRLGLLQTPQSFYDPDVFQHALYSEKRAPNEQDFFYRTIEPAKTSTNSVIYGGSNTVLSRKALEDIGGFYTGSITEDFATGLLIESAGYVSLALPKPLASGQTPHTFKEHIKQRTRWARGVLVTARKLKIWRRKALTLSQKCSYWSSVVYWYAPVKNLIYMLSPLLYALFAVPVFRCTWPELLVFWLPMFALQDLGLRLNSKNAISTKWSGIYETSVTPHLLIPTIKEFFGVSTLKFKVTDKSKQSPKRQRDVRSMIPFLILTGLSVAGIVRIVCVFSADQAVGLLILLFWIIRNLYFLIMSLFLIDGRDGDGEAVKVVDAEFVTLKTGPDVYEGVTTLMTEHSFSVYLDDNPALGVGSQVQATVFNDEISVAVEGVVVGVKESRSGAARIHTVEILDFGGKESEYWQLLYDRVPTLPQSLRRDFGVLTHLWQNIAHRVARTGK